MRADLLGELVGRIIGEQIGQVVARCGELRRELEQRIAGVEKIAPRVEALEKVPPPPLPEVIDHDALAERVLARVLERLPAVLESQGLGFNVLTNHVLEAVVARLPVPAEPEKGERGDDGVGIADVESAEPDAMVLRLTDGRSFTLTLPRGPRGEDGRFRAPTSWKGEGKHLRGEIVTRNGGTFWVSDDDVLLPLAVGIRAIWSESAGPREHAIVLARSDGTIDRFGMHIAVPIHRGAYDPEVEYEPGDEVAHNGCSWRCGASGRLPEPPGDSWLLVAKQGRPGRPGTAGEDGKSGPGIERVWAQDRALVFELGNGRTDVVQLPEAS